MKVGTKCPCMSRKTYVISIIDSFAVLNKCEIIYRKRSWEVKFKLAQNVLVCRIKHMI